jgi:isoleucyl-tRNA synthetase
VADTYRRIRNTVRFLLGNLDGFDPDKHLLATDACLDLDRWAVQQAADTQAAIVAAYERYDFPEIVQRVQNFCTTELGALYLDITKDRLYTMPTDSRGRRSAQSAMYRIAEAMVRWLAPIMTFTAEEAWVLLPGTRDESPLFETWYEGLDTHQDGETRGWWGKLLAIRETASRALEGMRKAGQIGASLDATLTLHADKETQVALAASAPELRFFFITSAVTLADLEGRPASAERVELEGAEVYVAAAVSEDVKCIRCWHHRPDVGVDPAHPEICGRCVENVTGQGEDRRWF